MPTHEIAGKIMGELEAFHGSRPAIDTPQILIVRGMSKKKIDPNDISIIISEIMKGVGARKMDIFSDFSSGFL